MLAKLTIIVASLHICLPRISGDLTVTLAVFSGRVDPSWPVPSTHPSFRNIQSLLLEARNAKPKLTYRPEEMPERLGYKGFLVQDTATKQTELIVGPNTLKLQELLLKTIPTGKLPGAFLKTVLKEMKKVAAPTGIKRDSPQYKPGDWNGNPYRLQHNNCYNYANDRPTNTFALPGRAAAVAAGGDPALYGLAMTAAAVQAAAVNDGLQVVNLPPRPKGPFAARAPIPKVPGGTRHLVALVVKPGIWGDFHWYRLDSDGKWSHKPGETRVVKYDNLGKDILDPRDASMGRYQFVCFMITDRGGMAVTIR